MALKIILAIVQSIMDHTISILKWHISFAFCYKSEVQKLRSQVGKLKGEKESLEHFLGEAVRKGEEIKKIVEKWLIRVDKAIAEANSLGKSAEKETSAIVEFQNEASLNQISFLPPPQQIVTSFVIGHQGLPSRLLILMKVVNLLEDLNKIEVFGVFGMGGVGKIMLVKEVHRLAIDEKLFDIVAMIDVIEISKIKKIEVQIVEVLGYSVYEVWLGNKLVEKGTTKMILRMFEVIN